MNVFFFPQKYAVKNSIDYESSKINTVSLVALAVLNVKKIY